MRSLLTAIALLTTTMLALGACGGDDAGAPRSGGGTAGASNSDVYPKTVKNCGREVVFDRPPDQIITGAVAAINLVAAAGGADRIVARYGEFGIALRGPAMAAKDAPILATAEEVSAEQLIVTNADLHIGYPGPPEQVDQLKAAGIPTLFVSGYCDAAGDDSPDAKDVTFEDVFADIEQLGELFGTESEAAATIASLRDRVTALRSNNRVVSGETAIAVEIFDNAIWVSGLHSIEDTQLETLGLKNVGPEESSEINIEALIGLDPDVVVLSYNFDEGDGALKSLEKAKQEFLALPGISQISAVKNDGIVGAKAEETVPDPFAVDGIESIVRQLDEKR